MRDEMRGFNQMNEVLWTSRQAQMGEVYAKMWESTGLNESGWAIHVDFKAALQWNLTRYPETDSIQAILNDRFRLAIPSNAAAITILDAIAKELGVTEGSQSTDTTIIGGETMAAPPNPHADCPPGCKYHDRDDKER